LNKSLRELLQDIKSSSFPGTPLFHTIDKGWGTDNDIHFTFIPENEAEGRMFITGLVPFIRDTADPWYLALFTPDAIDRHTDAAWDPNTNQLASTSDVWINGSITLDGDLTGEPGDTSDQQLQVAVETPRPFAGVPPVIRDTDSISTFNTNRGPIPNSSPMSEPLELVTNQGNANVTQDSIPTAMGSITLGHNDPDVSRISDTASRISAFESHIKTMSDGFTSVLSDIQKQQKEQQENQHALSTLLQNLLRSNTPAPPLTQTATGETASRQAPATSNQANNLVGTNDVGDSSGATGPCS
jgi:hypothetical protein